MNRSSRHIVVLCLVLGLTGCKPSSKTDTDPFDDALLVGHWVEATVHEKYLNDGLGTTWDTADDVAEEEADTFSWSRDKAQLIQEHWMVTGVVPRILTITKLDADSLVYDDIGGVSHRYHRSEHDNEEDL